MCLYIYTLLINVASCTILLFTIIIIKCAYVSNSRGGGRREANIIINKTILIFVEKI